MPSSSRAASRTPSSVRSRSTSAAQIGVDLLELCELFLSLFEAFVLGEVRLHREHEQRRGERPGDGQGHDGEQDRAPTLCGDAAIDVDRAGDVTEAGPAVIGRPATLGSLDRGGALRRSR